jgi:hypothetical protein
MFKKLLAFFVISLSLTMSAPDKIFAANYEVDPEFNPLCWQLDDCNATRAEFLNVKPETLKGNKDGFIENEEPCTKPTWGKCLPAGTTKTSIAFSGKKEFTDIGDFIRYNYNIAIGIAGILAVIMIVVSGIQWVTSGGNSEAISSAKKRIGGALIGLVIAYLSYAILNTVNPALVNLRLPQAFLIRPFKEPPAFCRDVKEDTTFALAAVNGTQVNPAILKDNKTQFDKTKADFDKMGCGDQYFINNSGGLTCKGDKCSTEGELCMPLDIKSDSTVDRSKSSCQKAQIMVHYSMAPGIKGLLQNFSYISKKVEDADWLDDNVFVFYPVCETAVSKKLYIGDKWEEWDPSDGATLLPPIKKDPFYEYYLKIDHLSPYITGLTYNEDFWNCYYKGDRVMGFVLGSEMGRASVWFGGNDAAFYVSPKKIGIWKSISDNGYFTFEQLKKGIFVEAVINDQILDELDKNPNTSPKNLYVNGSIAGGHVDPNVTKALKEGAGAMYKEPNKGL